MYALAKTALQTSAEAFKMRLHDVKQEVDILQTEAWCSAELCEKFSNRLPLMVDDATKALSASVVALAPPRFAQVSGKIRAAFAAFPANGGGSLASIES